MAGSERDGKRVDVDTPLAGGIQERRSLQCKSWSPQCALAGLKLRNLASPAHKDAGTHNNDLPRNLR